MQLFKHEIDDTKRYKNLIKLNKKEAKKHNCASYLWSDQAMTMKIVENAVLTNGDVVELFTKNAMWLAIRLKYTSPEVIELMLNFLNGNIDYTSELYGVKIFDIMKKRSVSYVEAILFIYENHINFKPTKEFAKYQRGKDRGHELHYAFLDEDGNIDYDYNEPEDTYSKLDETEKQKLLENALKKIKENRKRRGLN